MYRLIDWAEEVYMESSRQFNEAVKGCASAHGMAILLTAFPGNGTTLTANENVSKLFAMLAGAVNLVSFGDRALHQEALDKLQEHAESTFIGLGG